jgi:hypothetical protein
MSYDDNHSASDDDETQPDAVDRPNDRDVLCGRGGLTNTHPGNAWYRNLVRANRPYYQTSPKHGKILVAKAIVDHVFSQNPPCRFLEKSSKDKKWYPINWKKSVDKTSQALRERERPMEPQADEDFSALAQQMMMLKNAKPHSPQLNLLPRPESSVSEVGKRQADRAFSLVANATEHQPERSKKRKPDVSVIDLAPTPSKVRIVAPSATTPAEISPKINAAAPTAAPVTVHISQQRLHMLPVSRNAEIVKKPSVRAFSLVTDQPERSKASKPDVRLVNLAPKPSKVRSVAPSATTPNELPTKINTAAPKDTAVPVQIPHLILLPPPDYRKAEVVKNKTDRAFSLVADVTEHESEQSNMRKPVLSVVDLAPKPAQVHMVAPSSVTPVTLASNINTTAPKKAPITVPMDVEAAVTKVSARFWSNSVARGRVKPVFPAAGSQSSKRPLPSAMASDVSLTSTKNATETNRSTIAVSPEVELLSFFRNSKSTKPNVENEILSCVPGRAGSLRNKCHQNDEAATGDQSSSSLYDQFADPEDDEDPTSRPVATVYTAHLNDAVSSSTPIDSVDGDTAIAFVSDDRRRSIRLGGAVCRVCKQERFDPFDVPIQHTSETHPELVWPMAKSKSRRANLAVLNHCFKVHPHWPLWNTLSDVQDRFPSHPRAVNVFHRALAVAAIASPHQLGDTYTSSEDMNFRIAERIGLAEGYIKWGPWEFNKQISLQILASSMLRDYGTSLKMAIRYNWEKIAALSHQDRIDLFNNVFAVPYCIDNLRERGMSAPLRS